jgi:hypothetical protein
MNFIAGQLLLHSKPAMAFWLFVELIEACELRDIFQPGLPGLEKHSYIIRLLIKKHLPKLHEHFELHQVRPNVFASDWIFSSFMSIIPEDNYKLSSSFFTKFFRYKWEFFYKLILTILQHIQEKLLE